MWNVISAGHSLICCSLRRAKIRIIRRDSRAFGKSRTLFRPISPTVRQKGDRSGGVVASSSLHITWLYVTGFIDGDPASKYARPSIWDEHSIFGMPRRETPPEVESHLNNGLSSFTRPAPSAVQEESRRRLTPKIHRARWNAAGAFLGLFFPLFSSLAPSSFLREYRVKCTRREKACVCWFNRETQRRKMTLRLEVTFLILAHFNSLKRHVLLGKSIQLYYE